AIELGHRLEISLGMPGGEPRTPKRHIAQPVLVDSGPQHPYRLAKRPVNQAVRLFLTPFESAALAVQAQRQAVLFAGADLAGDEYAAGTTVGPEQHRTVIVELPSRDMHAKIRAQSLDALAADELGQVERVNADVAHAPTRSCLGWLVAPGRLLVALPRQVFAQPALRILDEYLAQSTERAGLHHMPRLPDHR